MLTFLTFAFIFFLPIIVALYRGSKDGIFIFFITMIAGWTGIGWVIALGMALFGDAERANRR